MDGWARHGRLERDLTLIAAGVIAVASTIGAAIGWLGHQLFEHLHHESPSDHFREGSR